MLIGDVLMFIPQGTINAQVWQNSMFYLVTALSSPLSEGAFLTVVQEFADWYQTNVHANAASVITSAMTVDQVYGENLFNVAELAAHTYEPALVGAASGTASPQFNAYGFTTPSLRRGMNSGQRRLPGCTETLIGNFGAIEAAALPALGDVASAFSTEVVLEIGAGPIEVSLMPIIVKRVRSGEGTPEDPYEYRLPRTVAERVYYLATGWQVRPVITTQNSRKTGRGI